MKRLIALGLWMILGVFWIPVDNGPPKYSPAVSGTGIEQQVQVVRPNPNPKAAQAAIGMPFSVADLNNPDVDFWNVDTSGNWIPGSTGTRNAGSATKMIQTVYRNFEVSGRTTINVTSGTPVNISASANEILAITNITGGNVIVQLIAPPAGKRHIIIDESGKLGVVGNVSLNVTSGTINGFNNVTLANTTDPATAVPRASFHFHATSTTAGFVGGK